MWENASGSLLLSMRLRLLSLMLFITGAIPFSCISAEAFPVGQLFLETPQLPIVEGQSRAQVIRLFVSSPPIDDLAVRLRADSPLELPKEVVVRKDAWSAQLEIRVGDDPLFQRSARIWAETDGWTPAEIEFDFKDNDRSDFEVIPPKTIPENSTAFVELKFASPRRFDTTIQIEIQQPERLIGPVEAVLPAGDTTVRFPLTALPMGKSETVSVRVNVLEEAQLRTFWIILADDKVQIDRISIDGSRTQLAGKAVPITVFLLNNEGYVQRTNAVGELILIDPSGTIALPPRSIPFTNGIWKDDHIFESAGENLRFQAHWGGKTAESGPIDIYEGVELSVEALDLAWHAPTRTFIACIGSLTNSTGQLVAIDPVTRQIVRSMELPKPASKLSLSEDGSTVWLASVRQTLQKVDLLSWNAPLEFQAGGPSSQVADLVVMRETKNRVAALVGPISGASENVANLRIFENGISSSSSVILGIGGRGQIARGRNGNELILESGTRLTRYLIRTNTLEIAASASLNWSFGDGNFNAVVAGESVFHGSGSFFDADTLHKRGDLYGYKLPGAEVITLPEISRAYYCTATGLLTVDGSTSNRLADISTWHLGGFASSRYVRLWPDNGFAIAYASNVLFFKSPLVQKRSADLALTFLGPAAVTNVSSKNYSQFDWAFEVFNAGPSAAANSELRTRFSSIRLGTLRPGERRRVEIPTTGSSPLIMNEPAYLISSSYDPNPANNEVFALTRVYPSPIPGLRTMLLGLSDLQASPKRHLLYGALSTRSGAERSGIAVIDPSRALVTRFLPVASDPLQIAVSSDERYVHALTGSNVIQRCRLLDGIAEDPVVLAQETIHDVSAVPNDPGALALASNKRLFVLDGTVPRARIAPLVSGNRHGIGFAGDRLWLAEPGWLRAFAVGPQGVSTQLDQVAISGFNSDFTSNDRYLYSETVAFDTLTHQIAPYSSKIAGFEFLSSLKAVFAAPGSDAVYAVSGSAGRSHALHRIGQWPPAILAAEPVPLPYLLLGPLAPWGDGGLAMAVGQQLLLFESAVVPSEGAADVAVAISGPPAIFPNEPMQCRITVTNHSSEQADRLRLTIYIPDSITNPAIEGLEAASEKGKMHVYLPQLRAHESASATLKFNAASWETILKAEVLTASADANPSNNVAEARFRSAQLVADLHMLSMNAPKSVKPGEEFLVSVLLTNTGPDQARRVIVDLTRHPGFELTGVGQNTEVSNLDYSYNLRLHDPIEPYSTATVLATFKLAAPGVFEIKALAYAPLGREDWSDNTKSLLIWSPPSETNESAYLMAGASFWDSSRQEVIAQSEVSSLVFGLDPVSFEPRWQISLPYYPSLVISAQNGRHLWAYARSEAHRIDLLKRELDLAVNMPPSLGYIRSIAVPPGQPDVLIAAGAYVQAFRQDIALPRTIDIAGGVFALPNGRLFVYSSPKLTEIRLQGDGLVEMESHEQIFLAGPHAQFTCGEKVFFESGMILDLNTFIFSTPAGLSSPIACNSERGEHYTQTEGVAALTRPKSVLSWDPESMAPLWSYPISTRFGSPQFLPLGTNGVYVEGNPGRIIRPWQFEPSVDLSLSASVTNLVVGTNDPIQLQVRARNKSRLAALNTRLKLELPSEMQLLSPADRLNLGSFHEETNVTLHLAVTRPGTHRFAVSVQNDRSDPDLTDNRLEKAVTVRTPPVLLVNDVQVQEGSWSYELLLSGPAPHPISIDFHVLPITAQANEVWQTNGTVLFETGSTRESVRLLRDDELPEYDETIRLKFATTNVSLIREEVEVTILDDDHVNIWADTRSVQEGDSGMTTVEFPLRLNVPAAYPVAVAYEAKGLTAEPGVDFEQASGTVRFEPGELAKVINLKVIGDELCERTEIVRLEFASPQIPPDPVGYPVWSHLLILNDDLPPPVMLSIEKSTNDLALLRFQTTAGGRYALEHRTNLTEGPWRSIRSLSGTGSNAVNMVGPGFYRVIGR